MSILGDFTTTVEKALNEIDAHWRDYPGLIICGSHTPRDSERYIELIKGVRENGMPYLGLCYGHQLASIEYARNVLGIKDATSEEWGKGTFVVKKRQDGLKVGHHDGETYWNNYEVNLPNWEKPINLFTSQFHPEYQSSIDKPHPLLVDFITFAKSF
jgi:CTP synthase (UTP-ammonia lyase)